jgi:excisionase family DNA binding protein
MAMRVTDSTEPVVPNVHDSEVAQASSRALSSLLKAGEDLSVRLVEVGETGVETAPLVRLPAPAVQLLMRILREMARGNAVTLLPHHAELTTQQAADILNVSRPHLIKLLEADAIPYHRVGTHRRVRFEHVLEYKQRTDEARRKSLAELADLSQELGPDQ